jgi:glycosyltransferase involved in cell wall biosynthesis
LRNTGPLDSEFRALGTTVSIAPKKVWMTRPGRIISRFFPVAAWEQARLIQKTFTAEHYDLIYSNTITNGNVLRRLGKHDLPTITHVHEMEYWIRRSGKENLAQVKSDTSNYIAVSEAVRENLVSNCGISGHKITVINGFIEKLPPLPSNDDRLRARKALGIPEQAFVIGACGAEYWRKGRDLIVHLLVALKRQNLSQPVHFVWVGGPATAEQSYEMTFDLRNAGVNSCVHFTGEVANVFEYYASFDVFALLSRDDPFPLVCLEAAAMGIPILCFAGAGGMPEFVEEDCGFVVPYLDLDAMAAKASLFHDRPALKLSYGRAGRQKVSQGYTVDVVAPKLLSVIEEQLRGSKLLPVAPSPNLGDFVENTKSLI